MLALLLSVSLTAFPQAASLQQQRRDLERELRAHPDSVQLLMDLGDVFLQWPTIGRFRAWTLYDQAAARAPGDPEPRYRQMLVGQYLGGDDGEAMMRNAIFRILDLVPDYRDIWDVWRTLYHGDGHRRRAIEALSRFDHVVAWRQRAILLIELERYADARALLDSLEARWSDEPALPALAAQAAFESGDRVAGKLAYARAVAHADRDTANVLWHQVEAIASPDEVRLYAVTPLEDRPAFFTGFWMRRDPDLLSRSNERMAEHFARWRVARDRFRVLHPQTNFHRSARWRAMMGQFAEAVGATGGADSVGFENLAAQDRGLEGVRVVPSDPSLGRFAFDRDLTRAGVGVDVRDLPEPDSVTRYQRLGLDGRGLIYLRFGEPSRIWIDRQGVETETWAYDVPGGTVPITFARASAGAVFGDGSVLGGGDFVVYPTTAAAVRTSALMLETDQSALPAPLAMHLWIASFRAGEDGWQEVFFATDTDSMAAVVFDRFGNPRDEGRGGSPVVLRLPTGTYRFGADGRRDGQLGRLRGSVAVPRLGGWLSLSGLLIVSGADTLSGRYELARRMPADLTIRRAPDAPVTLYAELYDLPTRDAAVRYEVRYTFEPARGDPIVFRFERGAPAASTIIERLVLQPGDVPAGTYRITLRVVDRILGLRTSTSRVQVTLR